MTRRRSRWERNYRAVLAVAVETAAALLGIWIMYQAISSKMDRPWLYGAALAMMGLPFASGFQNAIGFLGNMIDAAKSAREAERDVTSRRHSDAPPRQGPRAR